MALVTEPNKVIGARDNVVKKESYEADDEGASKPEKNGKSVGP